MQARTSKHPCQPSTCSTESGTASPVGFTRWFSRWKTPLVFSAADSSGGSFRFLNLIKPVMCVLPEVEAPDRFSDGTCVVESCCGKAVGKTAGFYGFRWFRKNSDGIKIASNWISKIWWYQYIYFHHLFCSGSRKGLRISDIFFNQKLGLPAALHGSYHEISTDLLVALGGMKRVTGSFQVVFPSRRRSCTFGSKSSSILQPRHVMNMIFSSKTKYNTPFIRLVSRWVKYIHIDLW